jgi:ubiquinone/menaquinone biosynthesis C-methylase UbiE
MIIEEMQRYYGQRASVYDSSMGYDDDSKVRVLLPIIERVRSAMRGRQVLEIACGPGFWTQFAAETAVSVTATDYNSLTLDEARKKRLPLDRVSLLQADAYRLDLIPGFFDALLAVDWLAHVPLSRMEGFLAGAIRRVRSGSPIVFIDQLPGEHSVTGVFDDEGNPIQERRLSDGSSFRVIKHFLSDAQIEALFSGLAGELSIQRFPECRRVMVMFVTREGEGGVS